jgi:hypothetical protein
MAYGHRGKFGIVSNAESATCRAGRTVVGSNPTLTARIESTAYIQNRRHRTECEGGHREETRSRRPSQPSGKQRDHGKARQTQRPPGHCARDPAQIPDVHEATHGCGFARLRDAASSRRMPVCCDPDVEYIKQDRDIQQEHAQVQPVGPFHHLKDLPRQIQRAGKQCELFCPHTPVP